MKFFIRLTFIVLTGIIVFPSCFPKNMKEEMSKAIQQSAVLMADKQFTTTIGYIEMFKLRKGYYPDSLGEITFVSEFDKGYFKATEYSKEFDKYELNLKMIPKGMEPYPLEFWAGLGCSKSNLMPLPWRQTDSTQRADSAAIAQ